MPTGKAPKIEAVGAVANVGFLVRPSPPACPEPGGQDPLGFDRLLHRWTSDRQVLGVSHDGVWPTAHAFGGIRNPEGVRHAVQRDIQ
jgi:hypothetical protein